MGSIIELIGALTDPAAHLERATNSSPMRALLEQLRGGASLDQSAEVLAGLARPLRLETESYVCPTSRIILEPVQANPMPECADALVADRLPASATTCAAASMNLPCSSPSHDSSRRS